MDSAAKKKAGTGLVDEVARLVAADLEDRVAPSETQADRVEDPNKIAILSAAKSYDKEFEDEEDLDCCNPNKQLSHDVQQAWRASEKQKHQQKVDRDKKDLAEQKAKRAEAKKKAQERSKANESRRGGRSM